MSDLTWTLMWFLILGAGAGVCIGLRAFGVPSTYVRDVLHVGAGMWVLGWPVWDGATAPVATAASVLVGLAIVPALATHIPLLGRFERSVSGGDEGWTGLVLYAVSFTSLTAVALAGAPFPAAAGLLALSLGDGIGGAVGRRFGRLRYRAWGKTKTVEGSVAVAVASTIGVLLAAALFDVTVAPVAALALGGVAAVAEALAPRSTDNAFVPAAVAVTAALLA